MCHPRCLRGERKTSHLLKLFEDHVRVRYSEATARNYTADARGFLAWLEQRGVGLAEVRTEDLEAYRAHLYVLRKADGTPYSLGNQSNRLSAIKGLFRFLYRRAYLLSDPSGPIEHPRREQRLPRGVLTREEARKLVESPEASSPPGLRDRAILETFYATGLRAGELTRLNCSDVDTEDGVLRVVLGKGSKDRTVPLTRAAAEAIEAYLLHGARTSVAPRPRPTSSWPFAEGGPTPRCSTTSSRPRPAEPGSRSTSPATACATPWPRTCSRAGPTSATSKLSSATARSLPPSATPTSRSRTSPRCSGVRTRADGSDLDPRSFASVLEAVLSELGVRWYSEHLIKQERSVLLRFFDHLKEKRIHDVRAVTEADVVE